MKQVSKVKKTSSTNSGNKPKSEKVKWIEVILAIVAVSSLAFNVYQFTSTQYLDNQNKLLASENTQLDNKLKELQITKEQYDVKADVEARYLIINGQGVYNFFGTTKKINPSAEVEGATKPKSLLSNKVVSDFEEYINRMIEDCSCQPSELRESVGGDQFIPHGILLYRIQNHGKVTINNIELEIRWKDFPNELFHSDDTRSQGLDLWKLRGGISDWEVSTIRLADLRPGEEVVIPLGHILGANRYFGRIIAPERINWNNSALNTVDEIAAGEIASSDEWIYKTEQGSVSIIAQ